MLFKLLTFLSGGILDKVLRHIEVQSNSSTTREKIKAGILSKAIDKELELRLEVAKNARLAGGSLLNRNIRPFFAYPLAFYYISIILDSMFHFGWNIAALPKDMMNWSYAIIGTYFILRPFEKMFNLFIAKKYRR